MNKSFLMRLSLVFFFLFVACAVAGITSRHIWLTIFESLGYGTTDFAALDVENQAMKTPLNLVMYSMPVGFGSAAVGFLVSSFLTYLLGALESVVNRVSCRLSRRERSHA